MVGMVPTLDSVFERIPESIENDSVYVPGGNLHDGRGT